MTKSTTLEREHHAPPDADKAPHKPAAAADVVQQLTAVCADTFALAVKTHGAHWNIKGPGFFRLHAAFEAEYQALYLAADVLAERLRALHADAPRSIREIMELTRIPEPPGSDDENELVRALRDDHRALSAANAKALEHAKAADDEGTADLLINRIKDHDTVAWMLTATLGA